MYSSPDNEVIFTLDTQYVRCVLNISEKGIKGHVTEASKKFIRNPKMYLIIENPIMDFIELKKMFKDKYLNIFADHDASYYIENGMYMRKCVHHREREYYIKGMNYLGSY